MIIDRKLSIRILNLVGYGYYYIIFCHSFLCKDSGKVINEKMKKLFCLLFLSFFIALLITKIWPGNSFNEQLVRIQAKSELGNEIITIEDESIEIQSVLLDYSDNKELLLKTKLALMKYSDQTRKILLLFGSNSDFQKILQKYGEVVIPVIHYFLTTDIKQTIRLMDKTGKLFDEFKSWWNGKVNEEKQQELGQEEQAWYAIQFIKNEGYDFLGQFEISDQGGVEWIQTERVTEGLSAFFTSGLRGLETRYKTDQAITTGDLAWAGVDVLIGMGTLKLLRAGKMAARSGKSVGLVRTTSLLGSRLMKSGFAGRLLKFSAVAATVYVIVTHPSLLTSALSEIGDMIGIPPLIAQLTGISFLAFVLLYPVLWVSKLFIRPVKMVLIFLLMMMSRLEKRLSRQPGTVSGIGKGSD